MRTKGYWSFRERHPLEHEGKSLIHRLRRLADRIDDAAVAIASEVGFLRIRLSRAA